MSVSELDQTAAPPEPMSQGAQRFQRQQKIESLFDGLDSFDAKIPDAIRPTFLAQMGAAEDPQAARAKAANQALLSFVRPDLTDQIRDNWEEVKNQTAQKSFGATKPATSDTELYGMLSKGIKERNDFQVKATAMQEEIVQKSFEGDEDWQSAIPKIGDPKMQAKLDETAARTFDSIRDQSHRLGPYVSKLSDLFSNFRVTDNQDVIPQMIDLLEHMPADQRSAIISLAAMKTAREMKGATADTLMSKVGEKLDRGVAELVQGARSGIAKYAALRGPSPDEPGLTRAQLEQNANRENIRTQLMEGYNAVANPQEAKSLMGKVTLGLAGALPSMVAVAVEPWIGLPLVFGDSQNRRATELMAQGVPEGKANAMAAPQALVDTLSMAVGSKVVFGKGIGAIEGSAARTGTEVLTRGAKIAAYDLTTLAGVTAAQQLMPAAMQDWGHQLDEQIPGVQWADKPDGTPGLLHSLKHSLPETAASVVALMLLGAGRGTLQEYGKFSNSLRDTRALTAAGYTPEQANQIADIVDPTGQVKLMQKLKPEGLGSSEQRAAIKGMDGDSVAKLVGDVAKVDKTPDGQYVVENPKGEPIGTATTEDSAAAIKARYDLEHTPITQGLTALSKAIGGPEAETATATPKAENKPEGGKETSAGTPFPTGEEDFVPVPLTPEDRARMRKEEAGQLVETRDNLLDWIKGKLPRPEDSQVLSGELRGLYENLDKEVTVARGSKTKSAEQAPRAGYTATNTAAANAFFAKKGVRGDLDRLRQAANEAGFNFQTPAEMLTAVDAAMRGEKIFANPVDPNATTANTILGTKADLWASDQIRQAGGVGEAIAAYAVKGAGYLEAGAKDFTAWSKEMVDHFGPKIEPHLKEIYAEAQASRGDIMREVAAERPEPRVDLNKIQPDPVQEQHAAHYAAQNETPAGKVKDAQESVGRLLALAESQQLDLSYGDGGNEPAPVESAQPAGPLQHALLDPTNPAAIRQGFGEGDRISSIIPELVRNPSKGWDIRGAKIETAKDFAVLAQAVRSPYVETCKLALLDGANKVVHSEIISLGSINSALATPGMMARVFGNLPNELRTKRFIFSHNHPSGHTNPSGADIQLTRQFADVAHELGYDMVDHIITNGGTHYSFREMGQLGKLLEMKTPKEKNIPKGADLGAGRPLGEKAPWEQVSRDALTRINDEYKFKTIAAALRQVDPTAAHILYANQKNALVGIERIHDFSAGQDMQELKRRIFAGAGREAATVFFFVAPDRMEPMDARRMLRVLNGFGSTTGVSMQDFAMKNMPSARNVGVMEGPKQGDMFSGGDTGGDQLFNLQGEEAKDFTGIVDKQAEAAVAKKAQAKAQLDLFEEPPAPWYDTVLKENRGKVSAGVDPAVAAATLAKTTEGTRQVLRDVSKIREFTPFRQVLNKYIAEGQLTSLRVAREVERITKEVPEYSKRVAITNWLQADGDVALLKQRAEASTSGYRKGYEDAMKLSPKELQTAASIQQFYKDMLVQLQKNGVLDHGVERYVNQMWKDTADGGREGIDTPPPALDQAKRLMMDTQHAKEKVFGSYFEGEQFGRTPVTKDIAHLVALYTNEVGKVIASRRLLKDLTAAKAADGRPLAAVQGALRESGLNEGVVLGEPPKIEDPALIKANAKPEGYGTIENPSFQGWKFLGKKADGQQVMMLGQMAVHPDIYQHMRNVFGESAIKTGLRAKPGDNPLTLGAKAFARGALRTQEIMKGTTLGFLSPFHQVQEGTHAIGHHVNPFWGSPETLLDPENPLTRHAVESGLMIAGDGAAMRLFKDSIDANLLHMISDKLGGEKLGAFNPVNWSKAYSEYLFHSYIPRMKMKTFLSVESNNVERYAKEMKVGTVTKSDVAYLSAKQVNNAYGHMNWADIGISPTAQHIARIIFLAPDFLAARTAFTGEAIKGALGAKSGREQIMAFATLAVTQYMTARLLNKVTDDDYHFDHPFSVVHDGREYTMRSVPEDIYKMVKAPEQFLRGRISPLSSIGFEALFQRNYRGEKVDYVDQVKDAASMFIPLTLRANPVYRDLLESGGRQSVSAWQQLMGSMGIHISRNSPIAASYKLASEFKKALSDEDKRKFNVTEDKGVYPTSKYQQLRYALEDGDTAKAAKEYEKLKEASPKLVEGFHSSLFHPFTGSQHLDQVMLAQMTPEQQALVELARHSRQQIWQSFNHLRQQTAKSTP